MAWRVRPVPAVSLLMDAEPSSQRRTTKRKRTVSPKAAKSGTEWSNSVPSIRLRCLRKVFLDERDDNTPPSLVGREGLCPALEGDLVEAGFGDGKHDAVGHFFQDEFDERRGLLGVIDAWLNGVGMPAKGKQAFMLDPFDGDFERDMPILRLSFGNFRVHGGSDDFSAHVRPGGERGVELHTEPGSKFLGVA